MGSGKTWSAAGLALALTAALAQPAQADGPLLPDLRQAPVGCPGGYGGDPSLCRDWDVCPVADAKAPNGECVTSGDIRAVRIRFTTAMDNVGDGPLMLHGRRSGGSAMDVRQAFQTTRGAQIPATFDDARRATATSMYFEPAPTHKHWHLMGFARMQLRTPGGRTVVADRKNGFCLGDRYRTADADRLPGAVRDAASPEGQLAERLKKSNCGRDNPDATEMFEGISVGSGDDYRKAVDFQWLDLTNVTSGTYDLVNTVNSDRTLVESRYDNNSSSISISVQWPGGAKRRPPVITEAPAVTLVKSCPGTDRCSDQGRQLPPLAPRSGPVHEPTPGRPECGTDASCCACE
ncbi:lysyl oxidase family protein [Lentzea sp. JNUCC 0626]|uniref:lysyl oxidase family protein n=1 Tax=Lentzea sp. JNUCC 0626 TaxID=3367513 RepID=UPI003749C51A